MSHFRYHANDSLVDHNEVVHLPNKTGEQNLCFGGKKRRPGSSVSSPRNSILGFRFHENHNEGDDDGDSGDDDHYEDVSVPSVEFLRSFRLKTYFVSECVSCFRNCVVENGLNLHGMVLFPKFMK